MGNLPLRDEIAGLAPFVDLDLDAPALGDAVDGKTGQHGFDADGIDGEDLFGFGDLLH
jgi:hypothetical protein